MRIEVLKSKLQQVYVTEANLSYRGSITIDEDLMDSADLHAWELVHVNNATNGNRLITYVLKGVRGSGEILMNGGAALHAKKGDKIHILSFCSIKKSDAMLHEPIIILTNENNQMLGRKNTNKNE